MHFEKKILILKQITEDFSASSKPASGIFRLEIEDGFASIFLSIINLRTAVIGEYNLFLADKNGLIRCFALGKRPTGFNKTIENVTNLNVGLAVGIAYIENDLPSLILFQRTENCELSLSDFKKIISEKCLTDRKQKLKEMQAENLLNSQITECENSPVPAQRYDDEAVATENYFTIEESLQGKLNLIKEIDYEYVRIKNEPSDIGDDEKAQKEQNLADRDEDERADGVGKKYSENNPYYLTVRRELEEIFSKFPEEPALIKMFPGSQWAIINYSSNKHYVVGLVREENKEKYICYGVPATYSKNPPEQLKGYCSFVPVSIFDLKGKGYWVMFQSALNGECIHID